MKKYVQILTVAMLVVMAVFSCSNGGYWNYADINLTFTPNKPTPGSDVTVKCSNYDLFDTDTIITSYDSIDTDKFYNGCFGLGHNVLTGNIIEYNNLRNFSSSFKEKKSNREAIYILSSNAVSSAIVTDGGYIRKSTSKECDKKFDSLNCNPKYIYISYPQELTLDKTSAKVGDKVTITSSKPFFDSTTFSKEKIEALTLIGYNIVWYSAKNIDNSLNHNIEKKPVSKDKIDFDTLTPTSVTFTVPEDCISGTIHVINEGGFVCDASNDLHLVGNVAGAVAYYSTSKSLTIIE